MCLFYVAAGAKIKRPAGTGQGVDPKKEIIEMLTS
jgi:hypothetical protein